MTRKRTLSAFHKGQQNTPGSAENQEDDHISRPKKVSKTIKTEPTDEPTGGALSQKIQEHVGPSLRGTHLAFSLEKPQPEKRQHARSTGGAECANCGGDGHMADRCIGPWDPVSGTIKACVLCNDASHGLDDCPILAKRSASERKYALSRYLILYRGGLPPIESSVCWVDLLSSTEYKEMLAKHSAEKGYSLYPWTREFAIRQHKNRFGERCSYSQEDNSRRTWWPNDPKTNSEAAVQSNLESLKKTESSSALKAAARQEMMESESEREWELIVAGLKVWPDVLEIAPKLRADVEKEYF
ncbi:hypothetical protein B0T09DRAFT_402627 [Sordaria sp. MPI-SDFR-AT-0083]|nr:hypothetical protein B0T09DRAFT_402627 [Sordaria sp. MPI-SDFR-AT-0083]